MKLVRLGKTGLMVTKPSLGCLPVQRCSEADAVKILRAAYEGGINFFDTANAYTDSERKIGLALSDVRDKIVLATKSAAQDKAGVLAHIENSLRTMKTDYIDLFQFHQVNFSPSMASSRRTLGLSPLMSSSSTTLLFLHRSKTAKNVATTSDRVLFPRKRFFSRSMPRRTNWRRTSPVFRPMG